MFNGEGNTCLITLLLLIVVIYRSLDLVFTKAMMRKIGPITEEITDAFWISMNAIGQFLYISFSLRLLTL